MSSSCFAKLLAGSLLLAVVGYFIGGLLPLGGGAMLALGLLAGSLIGGIATVLYPTMQAGESEKPLESGSCTIYIGNLPFNIGKEEIGNIFAPFGKPSDIRLVKDRRSRRFKGYAFVEMSSAQGEAAIKKLDGTDYAGRTLRVNEAKKGKEE